VQQYTEQRQLPRRLRQKLRSYFEFQQAKRREDDSKLMRALSASLRSKVAASQHSEIIRRHQALFGGCNSQACYVDWPPPSCCRAGRVAARLACCV